MPNGEQQPQMRRCAGSCRCVYNQALALPQARHAPGEKKLSYAGLCKLLTEWRNSSDIAGRGTCVSAARGHEPQWAEGESP
ncbi:MAG: helix-turn-helix domain-containing protein, partial [Gloeomargarita sp. DG02_3_bins_56]